MSDAPVPPPSPALGRKAMFCFSLFLLFFVFYMGAAVLQTPTFADIASRPVAGMPLGFILSLLIFPVSWALIAVFFVKGR